MTGSKSSVGVKGKISQVLGAVIDVEFPKETGLPSILPAFLSSPLSISRRISVLDILWPLEVKCSAIERKNPDFLLLSVKKSQLPEAPRPNRKSWPTERAFMLSRSKSHFSRNSPAVILENFLLNRTTNVSETPIDSKIFKRCARDIRTGCVSRGLNTTLGCGSNVITMDEARIFSARISIFFKIR